MSTADRLDGVRDLLTSRGIELPEGDHAGATDADTVHGIAPRALSHRIGAEEPSQTLAVRAPRG